MTISTKRQEFPLNPVSNACDRLITSIGLTVE